MVVDPFAAAELEETRTTVVQELSESDLTTVMAEGWTTEELSGDVGFLIGVWAARSWKPVWVGETDTSVDIESGPQSQATMVTTRVEGERLY